LKLGEKLEDVLSFTCPTPLSDICISCYIECCILVHIISFVHHASSWVSEKKIFCVRKVSLEGKTLYFSPLHSYHNWLQKLSEACRVMSRISLIDYNLLVIDYTVFFKTMTDLFRSLCFNQLPCDIINYLSFYKYFRSEQEHFNLLLWVSNRIHCSWVVSRCLEEHFNWLKR